MRQQLFTPRFFTPLLFTLTALTAGCAIEQTSEPTESTQPPLSGLWQVEDIDQGGVIDNSMITIQFMEENRIAGSTGCNRYMAGVETQNGEFKASQAGVTMRACPPAISQQERRFLDALNDATRYAIESDTWLVIYDESGKPRLKLIQADAPQEKPQDGASNTLHRYQCESLGDVSFRFLGPETIELKTDQQRATLARNPSASGAQYQGEGFTFWNKGDEALLTQNGVEHLCKKIAAEER